MSNSLDIKMPLCYVNINALCQNLYKKNIEDICDLNSIEFSYPYVEDTDNR